MQHPRIEKHEIFELRLGFCSRKKDNANIQNLFNYAKKRACRECYKLR